MQKMVAGILEVKTAGILTVVPITTQTIFRTMMATITILITTIITSM